MIDEATAKNSIASMWYLDIEYPKAVQDSNMLYESKFPKHVANPKITQLEKCTTSEGPAILRRPVPAATVSIAAHSRRRGAGFKLLYIVFLMTDGADRRRTSASHDSIAAVANVWYIKITM
uniref:Uncharacterized protein n=1 Tax=Romanomermis culicivorax TaxID=13658 RepID=A0A915I1N5_ROMCU